MATTLGESGAHSIDAADAMLASTSIQSESDDEAPPNNPAVAQDFRGGRNPRPSDVFIAIMGVTGSGKSSFISLCSKKSVPIGHDLSSCTATVDVYAYDMTSERTVYLIDTPGFDDSSKSDTEVLREIATWLGSSYSNKVLLHGIIYLHRITDVRMQGSAKKNLIMFKKLCGQDALKKVILVTTMWDKVSVEEATKRERDLTSTADFWGWMMDKGSSCCRHFNTPDSARQIVHLLTKDDTHITTNIQRELVDERRTLDDTSAGRELQSERLRERKRWAAELKEVEEEMREAIRQRDREAEEVMREERAKYTEMIKNAENEVDSLRLTMENLLAERDKRVASIEKRMEEHAETYRKELMELKQRQNQLERETPAAGAARSVDVRPRIATAAMEKQARVDGWAGLKYPCFSVALWKTQFFGRSPTCLHSDFKYPRPVKDGADVQYVSIGEDGGDRICVSRYEKGPLQFWTTGSNGQNQRFLQTIVKRRKDLDFCALGHGMTFYARWKDGSWDSMVPDKLKAKMAKIHEEGKKIMVLSFGVEGSYFLSWGPGESMCDLSWKHNLRSSGSYPKLAEFLSPHARLSVQAVALHPQNSTDFIIIYSHKGSETLRAHWNIEGGNSLRPEDNSSLLSRIETWWDKTCENSLMSGEDTR